MEEKKVLICPKISKYEWDLHKYKYSHKELIEEYKKEGVDYEYILQSHERQLQSRALSKEIFPNAMIVQKENLTKEKVKQVDITIALGGDNHFQYVSHFIEDGLMFGINSDYLSSEGVLLSSTTNNIEEVKRRCDQNEYQIEKWTRINIILNNKFIARATCDVFIGEAERHLTSRNIIFYKGLTRQQKSSGILVSTGSGSTGWFSSASRFLNEESVFDPKSDYAKFIVTEPYKGSLTDYTLISGKIDKKHHLKVNSLNSDKGKIIADSLEQFNFSRGSFVEIEISDTPLNVVTFP
jgi:NAD kinase